MSAPDRPTREQVDPDELDTFGENTAALVDIARVLGLDEDTSAPDLVHHVRAALVARTPQPAEGASLTCCDEGEAAYPDACPTCGDWVATAERADRTKPTVPLPAVPDGEDPKSLAAFVDAVRPAVAAEIAHIYDCTDYMRPDAGDVIADALATVRSDTRDRAEDQQRCNKVDECTAKSLVLSQFADWMETGDLTARRRTEAEERAALLRHYLAAVAARIGRSDLTRQVIPSASSVVIEEVGEAVLAEIERQREELANATSNHSLSVISSSDGEDVPARLDAAADALALIERSSPAASAAADLRSAAMTIGVLRPAVRAAVAAALALPTETQK